MRLYDVFIPITNKDFNKLKFLLKSMDENITGFQSIHVTSPTGENILDDPRITYYRDRDILDIDPMRFKHRPGWIYQMYLKMFQQVTPNDLYLTVDSDLIFNRPLPMFNGEGKPIMYLGREQHHAPYFRFQEHVLNLPRVYPHTFINDMNFISKRIVAEILSSNKFTVESFCEESFEVINANVYPAEPEIYGQYVYKHHRTMYEIRKAKTLALHPRNQSHLPNPTAQVWTDEEYMAEIESMKGKDLDIFVLHSWLDNNVYDWVDRPE